MQIPSVGTPNPAPRPPGVQPPAAVSAAPVDRVSPASAAPPLTMAAVRRIVENAAPAADRRVDIETLPFGIEIELEGFRRAEAPRLVNNLPTWKVKPDLERWTITEDASVPGGKQGLGGEAISPPMVLKGGEAERQIRTVLGGLRELGGRPTNACGLHIHVDASKLGPKGLANLMKMALEQEHALFKLSQNGQEKHRGAGGTHPFHYCKPIAHGLRDRFSVIHADSADEFRNALYGQIAADPNHPRPKLPAVGSDQPFHPNRRDSARYFDVNFNSFWYRGTIEFRIFNATEDPQKVLDDVQLALGMVATAANDDYTWLKANPLQTRTPDAPVSREAFEHFLTRTVADAGTRERLTQMFTAGGGSFTEDAPVDPKIGQIARLIDRGHSFAINGKAVHSPFEIAAELEPPVAVAGKTPAKRRAVTVDEAPIANTGGLEALTAKLDADVAAAFEQASQQGVRFLTADGTTLGSWGDARTMVRADGTRVALSADEAEPMLLAVSGRWDRLSRATRERQPAAEQVARSGAAFQDENGTAVTAAEACVLAGSAGRLFAAVGHDRVAVGAALSLEDLREPRPAVRRTLEAVALLQGRGYDFGMHWPPAIAAALLEGRAIEVADPQGTRLAVRSAAELEPAVVAESRQALTPQKRQQYDALTQLAGFVFAPAGGEAPAAGSVDQLRLLTADDAQVTVTVPGLGENIALQNAGQAVTLAAATAGLPPGIGALLGRHIVPALMVDVDRGLTEAGAARQLAGQLTVTPNGGAPTTYAVAPVAGQPAVDIGNVRVALAEAVGGNPVVTINGAPVDPRLLRDAEPGARHAVAAATELWTAPGTQAVFEAQPVAGAVGGDIVGLFPRRHFEVCATEESKIEGYRTTNEVSTWFPQFTLQGGAYLGVGAAQNYDHLTKIKSEMVFLVDADPRVAQDHRAILGIVGQSRNPGHFLSMLMGTRITAAEEALPLPKLLDLIKTRGTDKAFVEETKATLAGHLTDDQMQAVNAVLADARTVFLPAWTTQVVKEKQNLWLSDSDRFSHLRFLQNAGRITVRCASVTGPAVMSSIADQVERWNQSHFPPLTFNAVYLSNAEQWISKGNRQQAAYPQLVAHLSRLPLHPEGVILRTGGDELGGVKVATSGGNCNWNFSSLPMRRYLVASRQSTAYAAINKACLPHLKEQKAAQAERTGQLIEHLSRRLEGRVSGTRTLDGLTRGELRVRAADGREIAPHSVKSLQALAAAGDELPADLAAVMQAQALNVTVLDPKANKPMTDSAAIWEALQERPLHMRIDKQTWAVNSATELRDAALIERGRIADLAPERRAQVEGLMALRDAGWGLAGAKSTTTSLTTLKSWLNGGLLQLKSPMGGVVPLASAGELAVSLADLMARAAAERTRMTALQADVATVAQGGQTIGIGSKGDDNTLEMQWLRAGVCKSGTLFVLNAAELETAARMARGEGASLTDMQRGVMDNFGRLTASGWRLESGKPLPNAGLAWLHGQRDHAIRLISPMGAVTTVKRGDALAAALDAAVQAAPRERARMDSLLANLQALGEGVRVAVTAAAPGAAGAVPGAAGAVPGAAGASGVEMAWLAAQTAAVPSTALTVASTRELETAAALQRRQPTTDEQGAFVAQFDALTAGGWTFGAQRAAVTSPGIAWLAAERGQLTASRGAFTTSLIDNMHGWPVLRAVLGDRGGLSDTHRTALTATETLLAKGATVSVGDVAVERPEQTLLSNQPPTFHLKRRVRWGLLWRKHIKVKNADDLVKLAGRARA